MTPKQIESIRNKIAKIKLGLAADKNKWGGFYQDSGGLRYLPPELYLKLNDYTGALRYFNWFNKNFSDDIGHPIFLFEWALTLFKTKRIQLAEKKALETFSSNIYLIDKFLGNEFLNLDKIDDGRWDPTTQLKQFIYSKDQKELEDFADWLKNLVASQRFCDFANRFIEIEKKTKN